MNTGGVWSLPGQTSHLLSWFSQSVSYICYPVLGDHHALRSPKSPEGRVGWQVGGTQKTAAAHIRHVVRVFHVEESALHDLSTGRPEITSENLRTDHARSRDVRVMLTDRERSKEFPALE